MATPKEPKTTGGRPIYMVGGTRKKFGTVIPPEYHEQIYQWYSTGTGQEGLSKKIKETYDLEVTPSSCYRLCKKLKEQRVTSISAVMADRIQDEVVNDFDELQRIYNELVELGNVAKTQDAPAVYLQVTDRLVKLLQIKFSLSSRPDQIAFKETDHAAVLETLLDKLGQPESDKDKK